MTAAVKSKRKRATRRPFPDWPSYDVTCIVGGRAPRNCDGGLLFVAPSDRGAYRELARLGWHFKRGKGWVCPKHSR